MILVIQIALYKLLFNILRKFKKLIYFIIFSFIRKSSLKQIQSLLLQLF